MKITNFVFEFDGKDARITSKQIEKIVIIDTCKNTKNVKIREGPQGQFNMKV